MNVFLGEHFSSKHIKELIRRDFLKDKKLKRLQLIMTNYCNLDCVYCYANGGSYNQAINTMSVETAEKIINTVCYIVDTIDMVQFFGGEPLYAYKLIMYICDRLNDKLNKLPKFSMVSNFTILPTEFIEYIKKYNIDITVNIDGPSWINDKLRVFKGKKESTFNQVKNNINKLRELGSDISAIECTYTKTHEELGVTKKYLKQFFKDTFNINTVIFGDEFNKNEEKQPSTDYNDFIQSFSNDNELDIDKLIYFQKLFNKKYYEYHCGVGFNSISFFPNGDIYPCHSFALNKAYCMGNVYKDIEVIRLFLQ